MLNTFNRLVIRALLVLSLFGILATTTTFEATPAEAGACVSTGADNCG